MHGSVANGHRLARVSPPDQQLSALRLIRTVIRNPIETWPKPVYEQPLYRSRFLGREIVFVMEPDLIRQVLVDQADAFVKAESLRRALQPLLGDAILTADGARWRWQRQAAAPIFRPDQIRTYVPAMIAAAERRRELWLSRLGEEVNVAQEMLHTTFDIIAETMLSGRGGIAWTRSRRARPTTPTRSAGSFSSPFCEPRAGYPIRAEAGLSGRATIFVRRWSGWLR